MPVTIKTVITEQPDGSVITEVNSFDIGTLKETGFGIAVADAIALAVKIIGEQTGGEHTTLSSERHIKKIKEN